MLVKIAGRNVLKQSGNKDCGIIDKKIEWIQR